jgi:hypothetical protein
MHNNTWANTPQQAIDEPSLGYATLAQPVEQLIRNQQVVGSTPTGGSKEIEQN